MAPKQQKHQTTDRHPFLLSVQDVAQQLGTNIETGLSKRHVAELQKDHSRNELEGGQGIAWYKILIKQISNAMILVSISLLRGDVTNINDGARLCYGAELWSWRLH